MIQPQPAALADEYCSLLSLLAEHYPQALADLRDLLGASLAVPRVVELRAGQWGRGRAGRQQPVRALRQLDECSEGRRPPCL